MWIAAELLIDQQRLAMLSLFISKDSNQKVYISFDCCWHEIDGINCYQLLTNTSARYMYEWWINEADRARAQAKEKNQDKSTDAKRRAPVILPVDLLIGCGMGIFGMHLWLFVCSLWNLQWTLMIMSIDGTWTTSVWIGSEQYKYVLMVLPTAAQFVIDRGSEIQSNTCYAYYILYTSFYWIIFEMGMVVSIISTWQ